MPLGLLDLFKYLLIALIWLFFLRVIRAVWVETKPSTPKVPARSRRRSKETAAASPPPQTAAPVGAVLRLRVTPPAGGASHNAEIRTQGTVGRSSACAVPIGEDEFASSVHARIFQNGSGFMVEDLGSTNGTSLNGTRIARPTAVSKGDRIVVGRTVLEVIS